MVNCLSDSSNRFSLKAVITSIVITTKRSNGICGGKYDMRHVLVTMSDVTTAEQSLF